MNKTDISFRNKIQKYLYKEDISSALSVLEEWQDMDTNEMTGGHTRFVYNNYGSGRSDR